MKNHKAKSQKVRSEKVDDKKYNSSKQEAYIESILQVLKQKMLESQERKSQLPLFIRSTEDMMKIINDKKDKQRHIVRNQANITAFFQKRSEMTARTKKEQTDESSTEI
ncbi:MAG: hypothetical protein ACK5C5_00975 [Bacteroidota bacterium]|jgi:hypothetical protein